MREKLDSNIQSVAIQQPSRIWIAIYFIFFVDLSLTKAPDIFVNPRFWADEGAVYFTQFRALPLWDALTFTFQGSLQLLVNAVVLVAAKVPLLYAPAVTTYAAYLIQLLVVALIYVLVVERGINRLVGL